MYIRIIFLTLSSPLIQDKGLDGVPLALLASPLQGQLWASRNPHPNPGPSHTLLPELGHPVWLASPIDSLGWKGSLVPFVGSQIQGLSNALPSALDFPHSKGVFLLPSTWLCAGRFVWLWPCGIPQGHSTTSPDPFICQWAWSVFPGLGSCEYGCKEQSGARTLLKDDASRYSPRVRLLGPAFVLVLDFPRS